MSSASAPPPESSFLEGLRRELRALMATAWQVPGATPAEVAELRTDQWRAAIQHLPTSALITLVMLALVSLALVPGGRLPVVTAWLVPLVALNVFNVGWWWVDRQRPRSAHRGGKAAALLGANLALAGVLDAGLLLYAIEVSSASVQLLVVCVGTAMIAAAAWMFALLPAAALGWIAGIFTGLVVGIAATPVRPLLPLLPLMPLYAGVLVLAALMNARLFLLGRHAQREAARQRELVGLLLHDFEAHASDWLWEIDAEGRLMHVSQRLADLLGLPVDRLRGQALLKLLAERLPADDADATARLASLTQALREPAPLRDVDLTLRLAGQRAWWSLSARRLGQGGGWRGVGRDVTVLRERERELHRMATQDLVTGLANRHQLHRRLQLHLSGTAPPDPCTLILLDLDNFKQVNDTLGHEAGDRLLAEVGRRLRESLESRRGSGDLVARLGGDEFAVLLRGELEATSLQSLGKRLRTALAVPIMLNEHAIEVQVSLGAATAPAHADQSYELLRAADMALYAAKGAGRNRLCLFEPALREQVLERANLIQQLREAIDAGQFELHYQPQVDLRMGTLRGFEALLRWRHPTRGLVPPAQFIPLAEDTGLIVAIGAWALQRACKDAVHWPEPLSVAVNVSAVEFERGQVRREVRAALAASGLAPHRLEIELTESALLHDSEHAIKLLASLRQMGVRVALDDFGTGFSSLAYLRRLPLDQLKIDRAFVIDLDRPGAGATALSIVAAIHNLASALGLETVAEGIETAEQLRLLTSLGCAFGQGWLFARAMPAVQALQFIDQVQAEGLGAASARLAPPGASGLVPLVGLPVGGRLNVPVSLPDTRWTGAI